MALVATVHPATNPLGASLGTLDEATNRQLRAARKDVGSGSVVVPRSSSESALLVKGRYVRLTLDGSVRQVFRIGGRDQQTIDQGEEASELRTANGPGIASTLNDDKLEGPPIIHNFRLDSRAFNFASPDYPHEDSGEWVSSVVIFDYGDPAGYGYNVPKDFPDWTAKWMWGQAASGDPPMPVGDNYFRNTFTLSEDRDVAFYWAVDDGYQVWLDGELLGDEIQAFAFRETHKEVRYCAAGVHHVAIKATNIARAVTSTNYGGVIFSAITVAFGGVNDTVVLHSDDTWLANPYPPAPPGWSVGAILDALLTEAQARGALTGWTWTFTKTLTSSGLFWFGTVSPTYQVGTGVYDVLAQLAAWACDWTIDLATLELKIENFGQYATASGVTLAEGSHLVAVSHSEQHIGATDVLGRLTDGTYRRRSSGGTPVITVSAQLGAAATPEDADAQMDAIIATQETPTKATVTLAPIAGHLPWDGFDLYETVTAPDIDGAGVVSIVDAIVIADRSPDQDGVIGGGLTYAVELLQ